jgi:molybdenum cofactor biosynthesis protein B
MTPHPDQQLIRASCAVVTLSDTRTPDTDRSGQIVQELLSQAGHRVEDYQILKDEPQQILGYLQQLVQREQLQVIICHGGTGIAPRDTTYDVLAQVLDKTLPGFGELFRWLSYQEIGSRAMASRAIAGIYKNKLLFSLPGSSNAVRLAMEKLILPELPHLLKQITGAA